MAILQVNTTAFSVAVVVPEGDETRVYGLTNMGKRKMSFFYHRLDLQSDVEYCKQFFRKAVKGMHTTVHRQFHVHTSPVTH